MSSDRLPEVAGDHLTPRLPVKFSARSGLVTTVLPRPSRFPIGDRMHTRHHRLMPTLITSADPERRSTAPAAEEIVSVASSSVFVLSRFVRSRPQVLAGPARVGPDPVVVTSQPTPAPMYLLTL